MILQARNSKDRDLQTVSSTTEPAETRAAFLRPPLTRFIFLRWIAACAVLIAPVVLYVGLGLPIPLRATAVLAAGLAALNVIYFVSLKKMAGRGWSAGIRWMEPLQAALDLVILTILLFLTGGIRNPLLMFYVFHVIITGVLFDRAVCFSVAVLAILLVIAECVVELKMPGMAHDTFGLGVIGASGHHGYILCILAGFSIMLLITAYLTCDIADRLRAEETRLAAATEHLTKLERAKSRLLYFVAHEMKSPLVAVSSCVQAASTLLESQENAPDAVMDMLNRARQRTKQMGKLVTELLELSRQQSLPSAAAREPLDLAPLLCAVAEEHEEAARKKHIHLQVSVDKADAHVLANSESLHRAFSNLVSNAIQYTPDSGSVNVSLEKGPLGAKIVVADSGIGIPEEDLENIFQEFYRCPNAKETSRIGTGLGLAIVKTIIQNHGGRIAVKSRPNEGSEFTVWLPQAEAAGR